MITYYESCELKEFGTWGGAIYTMDELDARGDVERIDEFIQEIFEDFPSKIQVNDFLWFERDQIAQFLGYEDWEEYLYKRPLKPFKD